MGAGVLFVFAIAFMAAISSVIAGDPSILRIVGESRSRAIYGHCYITATNADLLACVDISTGSLSWRFPLDENQLRDRKKVVAGDKVAFVLSYSSIDGGATVYSVSIKDGSLLWSLPLQSGEFLGDSVDMTYSRNDNSLYVLLHNAVHKVSTSGSEPVVSTMMLNDSALQGIKLFRLIDSVSDNSPSKRGVAVGCIQGSDGMCTDSAVLQLNTVSGDSAEVTKMKSSSAGTSIFASEGHVYRVDFSGSDKGLRVTLEQTTYAGSQQRSSLEIDLLSIDGFKNIYSENFSVHFYRLEQSPIVHLEVEAVGSMGPTTLHFLLYTTADGKLTQFYGPKSVGEVALISFDSIASSSQCVRQVQIFTTEANVDKSALDGKMRVVSVNKSILGETSMVGLLKESEKTIVAEGGQRISAFQVSSRQSASHLWSRQEALAQLQQAILLPGLTMKTSSSFFGALDAICAKSQFSWTKPLCGIFDNTKALLDSVELAFERILPSRVPHHHSRKGRNTLSNGQDHALAISFAEDADSLAKNPRPFDELNLQVHSLVFPHDLSMLKALNRGNVEKSVLICSRRLILSKSADTNNKLVRSVRLVLVPSTNDVENDGTVTARVVADIVDGGVVSWTTKFSLEEDMREKLGDEYVSVLSSSMAEVKALLPTQEWDVAGSVAAVMPSHFVAEKNDTKTISLVPWSDQEQANKKTPQFVHTISTADGEISIYETRHQRKVANVKFDPTVEEIVEVTFPVADDMIYSRVSILGDDNILVKYLNPNMIAVCTATKSNKPDSNDESSSTMPPQVFVNLVDIVSGNVLNRIVLDSATVPVRAHLMENFVLVSYWNPVLKRAEILTMGLYDGVIGKTDYLPFASKPNVGTREHDEKTTTKNAAAAIDSIHSSADEEEKSILLRSSFLTSIPLVMQRTYLMPRKVMDVTHTLSRHGLTNKNLLLTLESGEIYSLDFRFLHPRRPMSDPTASEKEEGLMRYGPIFPLMPQMTLTMENILRPTSRYPTHTLSAPSYLESEALVFVFGRFNDLLFTSVTPSQGFDTLSAKFNYTALVGLITLLFVGVMILRRMHRQTTLKRMWQ